jgi:hypothetical protein
MTGDLVEDDYFSIHIPTAPKSIFTSRGFGSGAVLEKKASLKGGGYQGQFCSRGRFTPRPTPWKEVRRDDYMDQQDPGKKYKMILAWEENHQPYDIFLRAAPSAW